MDQIRIVIILIRGSCLACESQYPQAVNNNMNPLKDTVIRIQKEYVEGWLANDEERILSLFEENAMIQPNSLTPKKGKAEMREFWFPKDSSITTINEFKSDLLNVHFLDTLVLANHKTYLDWTYEKGETSFGMIQTGYSTTLYRKQTDNSWKIWRQMWTDIESKSN